MLKIMLAYIIHQGLATVRMTILKVMWQ